MKRFSILLFLLTTTIHFFGQKGNLTGKVTDAKTGEELLGATVLVEGTTIGVVTDFTGNYILPLNPGTYKIRCQLISYEPAIIEKVTITANQTTTLNMKLSEAELALAEVEVVAKANRENLNMLLMDQKSAITFNEAVGAQQLSLQGVSDAAGAATKISGIFKQSGAKSLSIRGLGDRYNTTTLNGLPLPSNNAELKNIDLELFSTDIIEYVSVEKVFTPTLSADFAGANVNVVSKKFKGDSFLSFEIESGFNSNAIGVDQFYMGDGITKFGFESFSQPTNLNTYNFENSLDPVERIGAPNIGLSLTGGRSFRLSDETSLNLFATASFENEYNYSDSEFNKVNGSDDYHRQLSGDLYSYDTQTTGMINLNLERKSSNFYINTLFSNSSAHDLYSLFGYVKDVADNAYLRRTELERTSLLVNQILGSHKLAPKMAFNWGVAYNMVNNSNPDRRQNILDGTDPLYKELATNDKSNNKRYYHDMDETEIAGNTSIEYLFGEGINDKKNRGSLTVGYSIKVKNHDFISTQYNHFIKNNELVSIYQLDDYFNEMRMQAGDFELWTLTDAFIAPLTYQGEQLIHSGFAMSEYAIFPKLTVLLGLRLESVYQKIDYRTTLSTGSEDFAEFKLLPGLTMKYELNAKSNLRFAASETYTLPQFKETAPFLFEGVTDAIVGNPYIYPSTNYNFDFKWECFPKAGELLSISVFGKYILDPINKFVMASATDDYTYANTGDWAKIGGLEFEIRKDLISRKTETKEQTFGFSVNGTIMQTNQELDKQKIKNESGISVNFNKSTEALQGAAPIIANASVNYKINWINKKQSMVSTLVYGYVSENLNLIGYSTIGNQVDDNTNTLDLIMKYNKGNMGLKFSAKNIINQNIERYQNNPSTDFLVRSVNNGVKYSLSVTYKF